MNGQFMGDMLTATTLLMAVIAIIFSAVDANSREVLRALHSLLKKQGVTPSVFHENEAKKALMFAVVLMAILIGALFVLLPSVVDICESTLLAFIGGEGKFDVLKALFLISFLALVFLAFITFDRIKELRKVRDGISKRMAK